MVRRRRPLAVVAGVLVVAIAGGAAGWWVFERGNEATAGETLQLRLERDGLRRDRESLQRENAELARRVAVLERSAQVESEAYARVREQFERLQSEVLSLKEEVAFYRGIVADNRRGGVRIQRFAVERDGGARDYRFWVVLTRGIRSDKVATGALAVTIDGEQDGSPRQLDLEELTPASAGALEYSFKHFQRIEGRLRLPERFVPHQVIVQVNGAEAGSQPLRETFRWPAVKS